MSPRATRRSRRPKGPTVALAGAGYIAVVHALAAAAAGMRVSAVASAGGRSARHLAGQLDARRVGVDQLPAGADVLVVATPPVAHAELALSGLAHGADVLIEKPLCSTLADADRLVLAATELGSGGRSLRCAENLLHAPSWRALMARRPSLGTLGHLSVRTMQPPPDWGHFIEPMEHGGVLFDLGPHPIALALAVADEPVRAVHADLASSRDDGADDLASLRLRFDSGLVAQVELSWRSDTVTWDLQAASDGGVLRLELIPEVVVEHNGEAVPVRLRHDAPDERLEHFGYVDQLLDLVAGRSIGQSVAQATEVLEVITAAYASAGSDDEVELPFVGRRDLSPMAHWVR